MAVGLDGREYRMRLSGRTPAGDDDRPRSSYHLRARSLLRVLYPVDRLLEEVQLPGCPTELSADFFLPLRRVVVEVQGEQHFALVRHFHADRMDFLRGKGRDVSKRRWCVVNEMALVELPYTEDDDEWRERIVRAHG